MVSSYDLEQKDENECSPILGSIDILKTKKKMGVQKQ